MNYHRLGDSKNIHWSQFWGEKSGPGQLGSSSGLHQAAWWELYCSLRLNVSLQFHWWLAELISLQLYLWIPFFCWWLSTLRGGCCSVLWLLLSEQIIHCSLESPTSLPYRLFFTKTLTCWSKAHLNSAGRVLYGEGFIQRLYPKGQAWWSSC